MDRPHQPPIDAGEVNDSSGRQARRLLDVLLLAAPLILFALLSALVLVDPAPGVTASNGPFTDEAWNVVNARNFVLLGRFSTDDWNLHLVNVPFSLVQAAVFSVAGIGMAQARLVSISAAALTMVALGFGLRRPLGSAAGLLASLAYGTSTLVMYYGRLAFLEPMVALGLTVGGLLALRAHDQRSGRWGLLAGVALAIAIGTKPSAAFAAAGILIGLGVTGRRSRTVRSWLGGATASIAVAGLGWVAFVGLPNRDAVATDLRIWASEPILGPLTGVFHRIVSFTIHNDHFVLLSAPIIVFGVLGWVGAARARKTLSEGTLVLLGGATGWLIAGFGILAVAPYRPNRYEVPLLPALAIVGAIGWAAIVPSIRRGSMVHSGAVRAGLVAALVGPGLFQFGGWMTSGRSTLPSIQAEVRSIVPSGSAMEGMYAPAFGLEAPVVTLVSRPSTRVNPGDLYASRGVRWYVGGKRSAPALAIAHPIPWSLRVSRLCATWGGNVVCLWQLP